MVNSSPWGSSLSNTAWRFLSAAAEQGVSVPAVFFQGDGVYHALAGRQSDPGALDLHESLKTHALAHGIDLMWCSAAAARRLPAEVAAQLPEPFREAGLGQWLGMLERYDRVVSF